MTSTILARGRRWWWIVLVGALAAAALAYLVSAAMTPIYQAHLTLLIEEGQGTGASDYNDILAAERRTRTFSRLVAQRPVLEETIRRLSLRVTPEELATAIDVTPIRDTQLVTLAVSDPSPARAAAIANTVAQVFIEQTQQRQAEIAGPGADQVQQNIDAIQKQIDEANARIAELQAQPNAGDPAVQQEIRNLQTQLAQFTETHSALIEAQQRILASAASGPRIRVTADAVPPESPVRPRTTLNTALGGVLGALLGLGVVLVLVYLDDTVKDAEDVRRLTGRPALGWIPRFRGPVGIALVTAPRSPVSEGYRSLRTNLQFATLGQEVRSILVTSARPRDGKTTTVVNLGAVLAQGGQQVIVVDGDLRRPQLHATLGSIPNRVGLTNLLLTEDAVDLSAVLQETDVPGLRVLTTGPLPPNPTDVLDSPRMHDLIAVLEGMADIVLIDAPPVPVSDALVLAGMVDRVLLVAYSGRTRSAELARAVEELTRAGTPLLGVLLNRAEAGAGGYDLYYAEYYSAEPDPGDHDGSGPGAPTRLSQRLGALVPGRAVDLPQRGNQG